jgi:hypothetical protein
MMVERCLLGITYDLLKNKVCKGLLAISENSLFCVEFCE